MNRKNFDLMAPVGSYESLMAAIQGGANSVYFGVGRLNMRAKSSINFTLDDLHKIAKICKENNIKSYLTINTIIYDHDLATMHQIIDAVADAKVDAIIASDIAVINYARQKNLTVHISTQVNITNTEEVRFYAQFADALVMARELNLSQVAEITKTIRNEKITGPSGNLVRIEMFIHGALCMAVSGKCYLSLHEKNSSANRGACLQTCRKAYIVTEKETGNELEIDNEYIMSPKDLCTISFIDKVIAAGVSILKIEGRARPAEYVKTVCQCYDEAIQSIENKTYTREKVAQWNNRLKTVFNRGFWDGYYLGRRLGKWTKEYGSKATKRKEYIGKITNYFKKINVAELKIESGKLTQGDEYLILGPTTGVYQDTVNEIQLDYKSVKSAAKGDVISLPTKEILRRSDKLYKLVLVEPTLEF